MKEENGIAENKGKGERKKRKVRKEERKKVLDEKEMWKR